MRPTRALALTLFAALWAAGCASSAGPFTPRAYPGGEAPAAPAVVPPPDSSPSTPLPTPPAPAEPRPVDGAAIATAALAERGAPYRLGGESPDGFDCSGLVQYVFREQGITLPRQVIDQFGVGQPVPRREIRAGDLVFFATTSDQASHVGIALDGDRFVDAPSSKGRVRIDRLSARYWSRRFLGARRIEAGVAAAAAATPSGHPYQAARRERRFDVVRRRLDSPRTPCRMNCRVVRSASV